MQEALNVNFLRMAAETGSSEIYLNLVNYFNTRGASAFFSN